MPEFLWFMIGLALGAGLCWVLVDWFIIDEQDELLDEMYEEFIKLNGDNYDLWRMIEDDMFMLECAALALQGKHDQIDRARMDAVNEAAAARLAADLGHSDE